MPQKKINIRAGFHHLHSGQTECGIAYWEDSYGDDVAGWRPCSKLVNHRGRCGDEDHSAL